MDTLLDLEEVDEMNMKAEDPRTEIAKETGKHRKIHYEFKTLTTEEILLHQPRLESTICTMT